MGVSKRIETIINNYNLNVSSFSKAIGLSSNVTIHRIVKGEAAPSFSTLKKIKEAFGEINADWILTGEGQMIIGDQKDILWYKKQLNEAEDEVKWHRELVETLKIAIHNPTNFNPEDYEVKDQQSSDFDMIEVVRNNPSIFGFHDEINSVQDAIKIICNVKSQGSSLQKASFSLIENHQAVLKLFKLGMRAPAVKLAKSLLQSAEWNQHYEIAMSLAKLLQKNAYLTQNMQEVDRYKNLYHNYFDLYQLEYLGHSIYGEMLYNYERGLAIESKDILANLEVIKRKTKGASCISDYYYYQCLLMINDEDPIQYESISREAIIYFEGLYLQHSTLISIFLSKLIDCYLKADKYIESEALIKVHLDKTIQGSTPWHKLMNALIRTYSANTEYTKALIACDKVLALDSFPSLTELDRLEWRKLKKELTEELIKVRR